MPAIGWEQSTCRKSPRGTAGGGKPQLEEYMSESTRLGRARGKKMLPVAVMATALIAMLAIASVASAATPNPISSGTTTLTINAKVRFVLNDHRERDKARAFRVFVGNLPRR